MTSSFLILKEQRLVLEVLQGKITLEGLIHHKREICSHRDYSPSFSVLMDIRQASVDATIDQVFDYINQLEEMGVFSERKSATLINSPHQAAYTYTFDKLKDMYPMQYKYSRNYVDLLKWMDLEEHKEYIDNFISHLKGEPRIMWTD